MEERGQDVGATLVAARQPPVGQRPGQRPLHLPTWRPSRVSDSLISFGAKMAGSNVSPRSNPLYDRCARRWRRAAAIGDDNGPAFLQVNASVVGLAGLEPAPSSLSGFCPRACFRRIAPATCANDLPLETAGDRCEPLSSDGMWTKRGPGRVLRLGPGDRRTGAPQPTERAGDASTAGPWPWVADGHPCSASHTLANAATKSWST
jgi:hypothetical protein